MQVLALLEKRARHNLLWKHSPQPMEMPTAPIPLSLFFFDALDPLVQRAAALTLKIENRIEMFRKSY